MSGPDIDEIAESIGGSGDGAAILKVMLVFALLMILPHCFGGDDHRRQAEAEPELKMCSVGSLTAAVRPCTNQANGTNHSW